MKKIQLLGMITFILMSLSLIFCTNPANSTLAPPSLMLDLDEYNYNPAADAGKPRYENIPYSDEAASLILDFYPVYSSRPTPLVIFAHANGRTYRNCMDEPQSGDVRLLRFLDDGYSVASIEFRHPSQGGPQPGIDISRAVQFFKYNAAKFNVNPDKIVLVGRSLGSIGLYSSLAPDMADPGNANPVLRMSTKVAGIFQGNAQTTWNLAWWNENIRAVPNAINTDLQTNAIDVVTADAPPLLLTYEYSESLINTKAPASPAGAVNHHPLFGKTFFDAANTAGAKDVTVLYNNGVFDEALNDPQAKVHMFDEMRPWVNSVLCDYYLNSVTNGDEQSQVDFMIKNADGAGYSVFISNTRIEDPLKYAGDRYNREYVSPYKKYNDVTFSTSGVTINGLTNGNTYYAYVIYSPQFGVFERSNVIKLNPSN